MVVYVSDYESWVDSPNHGRCGGSATATMKAWSEFKTRNPNARMVCIDLQPYAHTQAKERDDITNVGGFSDQVFQLLAQVARSRGATYWVDEIGKLELTR